MAPLVETLGERLPQSLTYLRFGTYMNGQLTHSRDPDVCPDSESAAMHPKISQLSENKGGGRSCSPVRVAPPPQCGRQDL